MRGQRRNDVEEEGAADREIAFTRVTLAWIFVLVLLFWITSGPASTESRPVQISICGSLVGGDASIQSEGECEEGTEIVRASVAMPQVFDVPRRMVKEACPDPKPFAMTATFAGEDGKALLTMRMAYVPAESRDQYAQEFGSIEGGKQTLERLVEHLSARFAAKNGEK
jgi:hypothetical protein